MFTDKETIQLIKKHAKVVSEIANQRTIKNDAKDIPEFIAYEIIDLIEYTVPIDYQRVVSNIVTKDFEGKSRTMIKKYFDLQY